MQKPLRQYFPLWEKIKTADVEIKNGVKTRVVEVLADQVFHKRIIKAVRKEKWMDSNYHVMKAQEGINSTELTSRISGNVIIFILKESFGKGDF